METVTCVRDHREQRDQASNIKASSCTHNDYHHGNSEIIVRPCYLSHPDWFEFNNIKMKPGVYWHGKKYRNGEFSNVDEWICSPLLITGVTSSPKQDNFGRLLRFQDSNGEWHEWAMPMHLLKGNGDELFGELLQQGVIFNPKKRTEIIDYLMSQRTDRKITAVERVGWFNDVFILPNQIIGDGDIVFQSESLVENEFHQAGTIDGWQQEIGKYCEGNIPLMISIAAVLSGPLFKFVDRQQGGGIHWIGDSSSGKSTAIEIAASVWGSPEFIRSWSATANGLEGIAAARNDTCLILDEIDEASPHEVGKIIYMLANGQGKQRAGKIGNARKIQRWRIITLSTGERTINSMMNEIGKRPNAGQLVRLLNIPVTFEHGAFSDLHGFVNGRDLSDHLKAMRLKHYGHIGPSFIRKVKKDDSNFLELLEQILRDFNKIVTSNLERRAATLFGIIALAGELAIEYELLPWKHGSVMDASIVAFKRYQAYQGPSQTEDAQILQAVSDFIAKHGDSRFSPLREHEDKPIYNRAGWYKDVGDERVYLFFPVALVEAGSGFERSRIIEALRKAKLIFEYDIGRQTKKVRTSSGVRNLYHISINKEL